MPLKRRDLLIYFFLALTLILNAFFLNFNAFRCFNFYDMCFNLDGAWRIFMGQKPNVDFISYSGPLHYYMVAAFFKLFGFGKTALWMHLVVVHSIVIVVVFLMTYRRLPFVISFMVTILTTTFVLLADLSSLARPFRTTLGDSGSRAFGLAASL